MDDLKTVCSGVYMFVLLKIGVLLSCFAIRKLLNWTADGANLRLGYFEALFPVRGRWLRYLLAPLLLMVAWAIVWPGVAAALWWVPAPFGLTFLIGGALAAAGRKLWPLNRPE